MSCTQGDIVFVVDSSGSIYRENWNTILDFMKRLVNDFTIGPDNIQVGVTLFGKKASDHQYNPLYFNRCNTVYLLLPYLLNGWTDQV